MSLRISFIAVDRLDRDAAGVEGDALADQHHVGPRVGRAASPARPAGARWAEPPPTARMPPKPSAASSSGVPYPQAQVGPAGHGRRDLVGEPLRVLQPRRGCWSGPGPAGSSRRWSGPPSGSGRARPGRPPRRPPRPARALRRPRSSGTGTTPAAAPRPGRAAAAGSARPAAATVTRVSSSAARASAAPAARQPGSSPAPTPSRISRPRRPRAGRRLLAGSSPAAPVSRAAGSRAAASVSASPGGCGRSDQRGRIRHRPARGVGRGTASRAVGPAGSPDGWPARWTVPPESSRSGHGRRLPGQRRP